MARVTHEIREALSDDEIIACFPVVQELRPHVPSEQELLRQVRLQQKEGGYHLMYIKDTLNQSNGNDKPVVVSILGYRISHCLFYGRHLYVDDLCTSSSAKKKGYAGALLDWAIVRGKEENCKVVTLDSGYTRSDAHRLYLNKRFTMKCHHFCHEIDYTS